MPHVHGLTTETASPAPQQHAGPASSQSRSHLHYPTHTVHEARRSPRGLRRMHTPRHIQTPLYTHRMRRPAPYCTSSRPIPYGTSTIKLAPALPPNLTDASATPARVGRMFSNAPFDARYGHTRLSSGSYKQRTICNTSTIPMLRLRAVAAYAADLFWRQECDVRLDPFMSCTAVRVVHTRSRMPCDATVVEGGLRCDVPAAPLAGGVRGSGPEFFRSRGTATAEARGAAEYGAPPPLPPPPRA